ncbi:hypothetical protein AS149_37135 [Burkholderia cenocepacia]|nr:hypothetical protein AS149_37135 [Burkholderia cenocepacia]
MGHARDRDLGALLDMFYPDYEIDESGKPVFSADDAGNLNRLFERCGLRLRVEDNTEPVINEAYQFCVLYLGDFLNTAMRRPDSFEYMTRDWPLDWKEYALSVVKGDLDASRRFATKLMPLAPDCPYPPLLRPYRYNGKPTPLALRESNYGEE